MDGSGLFLDIKVSIDPDRPDISAPRRHPTCTRAANAPKSEPPTALAPPVSPAPAPTGSATIEGRIEMGEKVIINIKTFMDGHRPPDRVLPSML